MTEAPGYQVSSTYARGFAKAVHELGLRSALEARLSVAAKQFLDDPGANRWWPPAAVEECTRLIHEIHTDPTLLEVGYRTLSSTLGPILLPLVKVSLTLFGASPATLLKRVPDLSSSALRGVGSSFKAGGPKDCELSLLYPTEVPKGYGALWEGAIRWVCETADGKNPKIGLLSHTGKTLNFKVSWS